MKKGETMKNYFTDPEIEVIKFVAVDVITTSDSGELGENEFPIK